MTTNPELASLQADDEASALFSELAGAPFRGATYAYGGELRLHFGEMRPYQHVRLDGQQHGEWVLSLRATPWLLVTDDVILARSHDEPELLILEFAELEGTRLDEAGRRPLDAALVLRFADATSFLALTEPEAEASNLALWELLTPGGRFLTAASDGSLKLQASGAAERAEATTSRLPAERLSRPPYGRVHTIPHRGGWANKREGAVRVSNVAATKAEAEARGREMARKASVEHLIHTADGRIVQRNTYARDPRPPKQ